MESFNSNSSFIEHGGGRAGPWQLGFVQAGYKSHQIESLRQKLLSQNDVGKVQRALRKLGIRVRRDIIQGVKNYIFDSQGIAFTYPNYIAWRRLVTKKGMIGDAAFMLHEVAEVEELQRIQRQTGFDFYGPEDLSALSRTDRQRWEADFDRYYRQAHSKALQKEYEFIAEQVNAYINEPKLKISPLQAAAIDPTRDEEALLHMFFEGMPIKKHHHFDAWCKRANKNLRLSKKSQRRLGYYLKHITLDNLILYVKNIPIE